MFCLQPNGANQPSAWWHVYELVYDNEHIISLAHGTRNCLSCHKIHSEAKREKKTKQMQRERKN